MEHFIRKNGFIESGVGWGNGYVVIPKGHALHGKSQNEIHELLPDLNVHGGLTLSDPASDFDWPEIPSSLKDGWVVGFDTCHHGDNIEKWPREKVEAQAVSLKIQLSRYKPMTPQEKINELKAKIAELEKEIGGRKPFNFGKAYTITTSAQEEIPIYIGYAFCKNDGLEPYTALYIKSGWECKLEESKADNGRQRLMFFKKQQP